MSVSINPSRYYGLNKNNKPYSITLDEWGKMMNGMASQSLAKTTIGDTEVSTVFLGMDHGHGAPGPPVLWETMLFGDDVEEYQVRYTSYEDAAAGHIEVVKRLMTGQDINAE